MFLETKNLGDKKVFDLVSDDFRYAKALDSFGIDFFLHYNSTLKDICLENDLAISYIKSFPEWVWKDGVNQYSKDINKVGLSWDSLPDITEAPIMVVQIGHVAPGKDFFASNSVNKHDIHWENKPKLDKVVRFNK